MVNSGAAHELSDGRGDELIARCYEAAAGQVSFNDVMHRLAQVFDCLVAQLIGVDLRRGRLIFSHEGGGGAPEGVIAYATNFHRIDPHAEHLAAQPVGTVVAFSREFDERFIAEHPFYQQYLIPYGVRHTHAAKLYQDEHVVVFLGLHRACGKSPIEGDEWVAVRRLCFHLTHVAGLYLANRRTSADSAIGRLTLDRLKTPVILVEETRYIVLRNRAAESVFADDGSFYVSADGRLCCWGQRTDTALTLALRDLNLSGRMGLAHAAKDRTVVRVNVRGRTRPLLASVVALRPEATMGAFGTKALAMIVLYDSNRIAEIDAFALAAAFDLSPAEAKVAVALARGESVKEIARDFHVSVNTVRTQVQSVHMKFGVSRTAEFIALIHSAALRSSTDRMSSRRTVAWPRTCGDCAVWASGAD